MRVSNSILLFLFWPKTRLNLKVCVVHPRSVSQRRLVQSDLLLGSLQPSWVRPGHTDAEMKKPEMHVSEILYSGFLVASNVVR